MIIYIPVRQPLPLGHTPLPVILTVDSAYVSFLRVEGSNAALGGKRILFKNQPLPLNPGDPAGGSS